MIWLIALIYSIIGFTWINYLVTPGDLLDFLPVWFGKLTKNDKLNHVLFGCEKCFAGQLALWTFWPLAQVYDGIRYEILGHFLIVIFSIFFAGLINRLYMRI